MKKGVAITLLIPGGIAVFFGISVAAFLMLGLKQLGIAAAIALTAGAAFGISKLRGVFANHYGLSSRGFLLCAYVSSAAASALFYLFAVCVAHFYDEFGWAFGIIWMIVSAAAVVLGTLILAISSKLRAKKLRTQNS